MQYALLQGGGLVPLTGRRNHQAHAGRHALAPQHLGGCAQVIELGAGAGADIGHVDPDRAISPHHIGIGWTVGCGHVRRQCTGIEAMTGARCGVIRMPVCHVIGCDTRHPQPRRRRFIGRDQAHLRTQLGTHIGQGHALLHRQGRHRGPAKFHRLVLPAVHSEPAQHVQHHVLGCHAFLQATAPVHLQRVRHAQPDFTGHDHAQHLGAANSKHVGAESSARWRMRVAADTEHSRAYMAMLGHHDMANALAVVHVRQVLFTRPIAGNAHDPAGLFIAFRHIVVNHQHDARLVPDLRTQLFQHRLEPARA